MWTLNLDQAEMSALAWRSAVGETRGRMPQPPNAPSPRHKAPEGSPGPHDRLIRPAAAFRPFPREAIEQSIPARFEQQVAAYPERLAVKSRGHALTYSALDRLANHLGHAILAERGHREEPVALLCAQGAVLVAAILGILKAGKFYVPLDPSHPAARLDGVLAEARVPLVVTDSPNSALAARLAESGPGLIDLDRLETDRPVDRPALALQPDRLAYLFYTSGSTGRPKGVVDNHRNVLHNVMRYTNALGIGADDRLSLLQSAAFSGSVSSLFCALLNGAAIFPYDVHGEGLGPSLAAWVVSERLSMYHSVPAIFRSWLTGDTRFPDLRVIRLEGDAASRLDVELYRRHFGPTCVLANGLGATETGLSCQFVMSPDTPLPGDVVPIGFPLPDMDVQLIDEAGEPVGPGKVGEIAVTSRYLAVGYWNAPELTLTAFTPSRAGDGARTYRTGDLGRRQPDGRIEYLGRKDFRVKIRGHRVDVAEVENTLVALEGIREAVVTTREERPGEARLVAYVVPALGAPLPLELGAIRAALARRVPDYMIPTALVTLGSLPLNANGKVDRLALPAPAPVRPGTAASHVAPRNALERGLAELWEELLGVRGIGVRDGFFDLGGDSFLAATLATRVQARFHRHLAQAVLAEAPTIEKLATAIQRAPAQALVVLLRTGGSAPPVFFVDIPRGSTTRYGPLAERLGEKRSFYVVAGDAVADEDPSACGLTTLAARRVEAIRRIQPEGPYALAGLCYGGVLAFEMAQQLRRTGAEVSPLVLVGISAWDFPRLVSRDGLRRFRRYHTVQRGRAFTRRVMYPVRRVGYHVREAGHSGASEGAVYLTRVIGRAAVRQAERVRRMVRRGLMPPLRETLAGNDLPDQQAFRSYVAHSYPGDVVLLLARNTTATYSQNPQRDWRGLATGRVTIHELPGDDFTMFEEPTVDLLAARLAATLGKPGP